MGPGGKPTQGNLIFPRIDPGPKRGELRPDPLKCKCAPPHPPAPCSPPGIIPPPPASASHLRPPEVRPPAAPALPATGGCSQVAGGSGLRQSPESPLSRRGIKRTECSMCWQQLRPASPCAGILAVPARLCDDRVGQRGPLFNSSPRGVWASSQVGDRSFGGSDKNQCVNLVRGGTEFPCGRRGPSWWLQ